MERKKVLLALKFFLAFQMLSGGKYIVCKIKYKPLEVELTGGKPARRSWLRWRVEAGWRESGYSGGKPCRREGAPQLGGTSN